MEIKAEVKAIYKAVREIPADADLDFADLEMIALADFARDALAEALEMGFKANHRWEFRSGETWCPGCQLYKRQTTINKRHTWTDENWRQEAERKLAEE